MKKRQLEVRENRRKSLCQIAKIVGPEMLYAIVLELKFHLRDNFQKHIFNFTVYEIIQAISPLKHGEIDYCLPLILPMIIDEIFGQSSEEKKMVEANEVPVLNMETKKKKGH
jgi:U3 small nucleolar RNA-associated protein 20